MIAKPWTEGELAILIQYGSRKTDAELAEKLPDRTLAAIKSKRHEIGVFKGMHLHDYQKIPSNGKMPPMRITDLARPPEMEELMVAGISKEQLVLTLFVSTMDKFSIDTLRLLSKKINEVVRRKKNGKR